MTKKRFMLEIKKKKFKKKRMNLYMPHFPEQFECIV